jgi:hypothetical protein
MTNPIVQKVLSYYPMPNTAGVQGIYDNFVFTPTRKTTQNGILQSGAVASVHLKGGTANGTGFLFEIHGIEGDLAIVPADPRQTTYIQVSEFTVRGAQAGKPLADLSIPESYRWVPPLVGEFHPLARSLNHVKQLVAFDGHIEVWADRPSFANAFSHPHVQRNVGRKPHWDREWKSAIPLRYREIR